MRQIVLGIHCIIDHIIVSSVPIYYDIYLKFGYFSLIFLINLKYKTQETIPI